MYSAINFFKAIQHYIKSNAYFQNIIIEIIISHILIIIQMRSTAIRLCSLKDIGFIGACNRYTAAS